MKVLHGAYINGWTFARPLPSQHCEFCNTMQAHRSDSKKDQWQTDRQGKEYLLGHRPHISSLPTSSHSSQPPWDVWVPFYKSGNWGSKEVKCLISNHRGRIITQAWTHTLSYNMLVPKDGKMMVKKYHCQNATCLPNSNSPAFMVTAFVSHRGPEGHLPLPANVRCRRPFLSASWWHCLGLSTELSLCGPLLFLTSSLSPSTTQCYSQPRRSPLCYTPLLFLITSVSSRFSGFLQEVGRWFT